MRQVFVLLALQFLAFCDGSDDWIPIKKYSQLDIVSANEGSDGVFYQPPDSDVAEKTPPGFSIGSGLRSIAQGSADQANSAVASQHVAAEQAAYVAKNALAQSAAQAAATAQTALTGKEALFDNLKKQADRALRLLDAEIVQLELAKKSTANAETSAQHSKNHVAVLVAALNSAKMVAEQTRKSANEASAELASQTAKIGKTKLHMKSLEERLKAARLDYEATKDAAEKATFAAHVAQRNAQIAGNQVTHHVIGQLDEVEPVVAASSITTRVEESKTNLPSKRETKND